MGGWKVIRVNPKGQVGRVIKLPFVFPKRCIFSGEDLYELDINSACEPLTLSERQARPLGRRLFRVVTPFKGIRAQYHSG